MLGRRCLGDTTDACRTAHRRSFCRLAENKRPPILMLNIIFFQIFELSSCRGAVINDFLVLRVLYGVAMGGIWGVASSLSSKPFRRIVPEG